MKSIRPSSLLALLGALAGLMLGPLVVPHGPEVDAGVAVRLDTEGLVRHSERILEGRVLARRTVERADGSLDTEYRLRLARSFLASERQETSVRLPGGLRADGSGLLIAGIPRLEPGEDVLLFLGQGEGTGDDPTTGRALPVGLAQGRYTLLTDRHGVRRAMRSGVATAVTGRAPTAGLRGAESRPYADLVAEIEAAVNRRRAFERRGR